MCFSQALPSIVSRVQKRRVVFAVVAFDEQHIINLLLNIVLLIFCFLLQKLCTNVSIIVATVMYHRSTSYVSDRVLDHFKTC